MTHEDHLDAFDWSTTPLGPKAEWSSSLANAFELTRAAACPVAIAWGSELALIFNAAFARSARLEPSSLGASATAAFDVRWNEVGPFFEGARAGVRAELEGFVYAPIRFTEGAGAISGVLVTSVETTSDLRQTFLERERQARAEAEEANRVKDEFLAMLGHELRNPLAPISTALELMRLRGDASNIRERAVIERQVEHLVRLVDDLLDISRITRGKVELKRSLVDVADVVARAIELASPLIEQRQHNLKVEVPRGLVVMGDPTRLAQAVSNLLTNAAKYTDAGGNISVRGYALDASVVVQVSDDGRGLTPELSARVFELFFQERQALDRSQGGLGLGLAIVQTLVQAHGGSVMVASDGPGKGSTFSIRLPEAAPRKTTSRTNIRAVRRPGGEPTRPRTILVVDDNVDAAELLSMGLEAAGHRVEIAHDGPSALESVRTLRPDVAILDIGLPVMDGYELARIMLEMPELVGCRLIAVTGYGLAADRERSREAGFARHLVKPVSVERVLEEVEAADEPVGG